MKRLLVVKSKGTILYLRVTEKSEIIKNPIPILWFNGGLYGWIPVEIIKNEVAIFLDNTKISGTTSVEILKFTWGQSFVCRKDIGEILMSFAEEQTNIGQYKEWCDKYRGKIQKAENGAVIPICDKCTKRNLK